MDYGNTKTPRMYRRLGSATMSQLAFPGESDPNFHGRNPNGTIQVLKKKKSVQYALVFVNMVLLGSTRNFSIFTAECTIVYDDNGHLPFAVGKIVATDFVSFVLVGCYS